MHQRVHYLGGRSALQVNPQLWADTACLTTDDVNLDGITDDCGPRCIAGSNPGAPCKSNADCMGGSGRCNGGAAPRCVGGERPGSSCSFDGDCGVDGACRGGLAYLACIAPAGAVGNTCTDAASCGAGGICFPVGFMACNLGDIAMAAASSRR